MSTYTNFTVETDADGIALVTWDMPEKSMNVFTAQVLEELDAIVDATVADAAVKGVVFTSGKSTFSGGADLSMIKSMFSFYHEEKEKNPDEAAKKLFDLVGKMNWLYRKLETNGKPWVSAINGTCMGGALELSLACHGRVASNAKSVKLALPEIKVGIFPGAGGTQRVSRLTDAQSALQMMTTGQSLTASRAKSMNLVHQVVEPDQLIPAAKQMIKDGLKPVAPWDEKGFKAPGGGIWTPAAAQLWPAAPAILRRESAGNYPAALAILKCVYEGLQLPFDTALKVEQRYFTEILRSKEAFAMIRSLFISMQELGKGARRPAGQPKSDLKHVGIVGAGFMGASIAYVTAVAGLDVTLIDRDDEAAAKGKTTCEGLVKDSVGKGRMTQEEGAAILARITPSADYASLKTANLVIEAVFEDRDVKKAVIEAVEAVLPEGAIFASNTSTLPITGLAQNSKRPTDFIGIHFFSPVEKMMLTEVIIGKETGDKALAVALDYVAKIKKTPIVVNDTRGFFVNRCVLRYMAESYDMLIEGVPAAMIENAAKFAGMPVGPLALNDEVAIDLSYKILKATVADLGEKAVDVRHMELVKKMVEGEGRFGRKNAKGFYDYPAKPAKKSLWPGLKDLHAQKKPEDVDMDVLKQRFLVTIALEAARTVEEGIVTDPREADVGSILGFGFAPYTGGALSYIDGMGVKTFVALAEKLSQTYGPHFKPTPLLQDMAAKGDTFYGRFDPYGAAAKAA
ncbi:FAD-dependent oxidoreductase [Agrobacterium rubi]|uniref:3-hydroxyacyl-CoA dehydrogenase n=1 Tax=Agrobacterium rubi TaxID=28099 RepID=A0AAE7R1W9_9HYPH|nr:FAD-dependent oxidoreductase [Agrobacterium rubi]NTE85344.1 3-hydroxyacyl-CoA dehydrogenase [Agrobacterium rubi]NTF01276.1 3-hydroxyacyl-CoA dehydrogenase [Agrobacterium rubi]NTF35463.1 3-hydroxyacyl-CoA dehydrogenase [Agrobacterium rubi]OCJ48542.1 3-hydroxyacyl-CoA dehydrogenase [Agrobacterium rubi]QTG00648.1 3-hydroxyacyl-CoA dehydrogenase [Agrobacterium rubi]